MASRTRATGSSPSTRTSRRCRKRSDVVLQLAERGHPGLAAGDDARAGRTAAQRDAQHGRAAPHPAAQDHLPRVHAPRRSDGWRRSSRQRAQNIAKTAAAEGSGDFVEQVSCELPLQAIRRPARCARRTTATRLFRWSNEMTGGEDPEYADVDPAQSSMELIMYAMAMADERQQNPTDDIVTTLIQADIDGEKLSDDEFGFFVIMLAVAGNETTRNSITHGMIAFAQQPRPVGALQEGAPGDGSRRDHRAGRRRCRRSSAPPTRTLELGGVQIKKGQRLVMSYRSANFDEEVFERPTHVQYPARPEPARRLRRHRRALLHRREPGADDDQPDLQRGRRPHARSQADRRAGTATVRVAQRHQALAGRLHRRRRAGEKRRVPLSPTEQLETRGGVGWISHRTRNSRLSPTW